MLKQKEKAFGANKELEDPFFAILKNIPVDKPPLNFTQKVMMEWELETHGTVKNKSSTPIIFMIAISLLFLIFSAGGFLAWTMMYNSHFRTFPAFYFRKELLPEMNPSKIIRYSYWILEFTGFLFGADFIIQKLGFKKLEKV